jgi:hypothetical protein
MILNLTQYAGTEEQGVTDLTGGADRERLKSLLTFEAMPSRRDILFRARAIAELAATTEADAAMIGGAPYLMAPLEEALKLWGIMPLYAFSLRESVEETMPDGTVKKTAVFKHQGFIKA